MNKAKDRFMVCFGVAFKQQLSFLVLLVVLLGITVDVGAQTPETQNLTPSAQAGQLLLLTMRLDGQGRRLLKLDAATKKLISTIQPGGVILYAQNMEGMAQIRNLVREVRTLCKIPPFIAIDEEGGRVSRLKSTKALSTTVIPPARVLARGGELAVQEAYRIIAEDLWLLGINMNFAPVLDLDFNPEEAYLGDRSFGLDPLQVGRFGLVAMDELTKKGIVAVAKHFPGHGRSAGDSHTGAREVRVSRQDLEKDIAPFKYLIERRLPALMSSHLVYTALEPQGWPASISWSVITNLARRELGFKGLVITDALEMKGLNSKLNEQAAAIMAIEAGTDLIMAPSKPEATLAALTTKIKADAAFARHVNLAVDRILKVKRDYLLAESPGLLISDSQAAGMLADKAKTARLAGLLQIGQP